MKGVVPSSTPRPLRLSLTLSSTLLFKTVKKHERKERGVEEEKSEVSNSAYEIFYFCNKT